MPRWLTGTVPRSSPPSPPRRPRPGPRRRPRCRRRPPRPPCRCPRPAAPCCSRCSSSGRRATGSSTRRCRSPPLVPARARASPARRPAPPAQGQFPAAAGLGGVDLLGSDRPHQQLNRGGVPAVPQDGRSPGYAGVCGHVPRILANLMPMPAEPVLTAPRAPRRARYVIPSQTPRRGELLAAIGVLLVLFHVIFAQLTLILALIFFGVTKVTRWRPAWLEVPAAAGLPWTLAIGPATALAGFAAGPSLVVSYLGGISGDSSRLLHLGVAYAGMGHWLPRQLPVALMTGAAEAGIAAWLDWLHTDEWDVPPPRPGLGAAIRRAVVTHTIRSGGVVVPE